MPQMYGSKSGTQGRKLHKGFVDITHGISREVQFKMRPAFDFSPSSPLIHSSTQKEERPRRGKKCSSQFQVSVALNSHFTIGCLLYSERYQVSLSE